MLSSRRRLLGGTLALAAGLVLPATAHATTGLPAEVVGHAPALHPEGIAYDPTRHAFLVGSVRHGTVSVVAPDGSVRTLVADPRMPSTIGLHVDAARGRILVCYGDIGVSDHSQPDPALRRTGLGIFDLRTGAPLHVVDLADGTHTANDVTFDRAGNAYVTDSMGDTIWRVDAAGHASVFVQDPRFAGTGVGINGIVWHPDGYLLVGKYDTGTVFRIPTRGAPEVTEVRLARPLIGADGLALHANGDLVAVTNTLAAPAAVEAVTVLRPVAGGRALRVLDTEPWPVAHPTTIAVSPFGDYAVSGQVDVLLGGGTSDTFTLRRR
jgi:sugar lactone lactonase YvrE